MFLQLFPIYTAYIYNFFVPILSLLRFVTAIKFKLTKVFLKKITGSYSFVSTESLPSVH